MTIFLFIDQGGDCIIIRIGAAGDLSSSPASTSGAFSPSISSSCCPGCFVRRSSSG